MRRIAVCLFTVALFTGVGCITAHPGPLRPASAPVPPSDEIEILDPGQGSTHVSPVLTAVGEDGIQRVEVPPVVLVHRYFPSGDRSFQAQFLPGGPTVVAVNHPHTLERVYVPVTMPPGAPRVTYAGKRIIYDYGPQSVTVSFKLCDKPTVSYSQGTVIGERVRTAAENVADGVAGLAQRARVGEGAKKVADATGGLVNRTADALGSLHRSPPLPPEEPR